MHMTRYFLYQTLNRAHGVTAAESADGRLGAFPLNESQISMLKGDPRIQSPYQLGGTQTRRMRMPPRLVPSQSLLANSGANAFLGRLHAISPQGYAFFVTIQFHSPSRS
jgi:hypothetical protein